jgi:mutator family transposase
MAEERMAGVEALHKLLERAAPDVLREILTEAVTKLMGAEIEALCGAGYGERSAERVNTPNGYRPRPWDTRLGSIDLAIPSCAKARTSPADCSSRGGGRSGRSWQWSPRAMCSGSRRGRWRTWCPAPAHGTCGPVAREPGLGAGELTPARGDEFLEARRTEGYTLWLSPKAMAPVLAYLRGLDVVPTPSPVGPATPAEELVPCPDPRLRLEPPTASRTRSRLPHGWPPYGRDRRRAPTVGRGVEPVVPLPSRWGYFR